VTISYLNAGFIGQQRVVEADVKGSDKVTVKVKGIDTFRERRILSLVSVMRRDRNIGKRKHPRRRQHLSSRLGRARAERVACRNSTCIESSGSSQWYSDA